MTKLTEKDYVQFELDLIEKSIDGYIDNLKRQRKSLVEDLEWLQVGTDASDYDNAINALLRMKRIELLISEEKAKRGALQSFLHHLNNEVK